MNEETSQEELQKRLELAKENCIFCKIGQKEIQSHIVFEDELCFATLDIHPASTGHLLLMPKEHYALMPFVPDEVLGHLSVISNYLCDLLKEMFSADDVTVFAANGAAAGQQVQHFAYHIIPRYPGDELHFTLPGSQENEELHLITEQLKQKLNQMNNQTSE